MASIKKRPNGKWRARYRDPAGREHARHFGRKVDAQGWLDEVTTSLVTGQYVAPEAGQIAFRDYAEDWRKAQVHRPSSAAHVERMLRRHAYPAFGDRPLASILPSEVQSWVKRLSLILAPSTVGVVHGIVAGVFKAAIRDRRLTTSPCEGTRLPQEHREQVVPLQVEELAALEAALPEWLRALVTLAASTGLRQGEALGLTVDRSGLRPPSARPTLRVNRQLVTLARQAPFLGPPKRRASRRDLPLPRTAVETLAAHLAEFPPTPQEIVCRDTAGRPSTAEVELVFTTPAGKPIRRNAFSRHWRAAVKASGVPEGTTFHDLRHFYTSLLIRHDLRLTS